MSNRCDHHDCSAPGSPTTDETAQSGLRSIGRHSFGTNCVRTYIGFYETYLPIWGFLYLSLVANIGLVLFLFLVGLEIDTGIIEGNARLALPIALGGTALSFGLGVALSVVSQIYRLEHQIHLFHALYWCCIFDHCFSSPIQNTHRVHTRRHHSRHWVLGSQCL